MRNSSKIRHVSFLNSRLPVVSERVKEILSNPREAKKLADAVRSYRKDNNSHTSK